ncbi:hypothetical protein FHW13_000618 [Dokdonella fugitiva]|nr:hypothetical protein [Dokdonella fugitiva]
MKVQRGAGGDGAATARVRMPLTDDHPLFHLALAQACA